MDPADTRRREKHHIDMRFLEEEVDAALVGQIEMRPRARHDVAVARALEPPHQRRPDHPAMPRHEDACVLVHVLTRDVREP